MKLTPRSRAAFSAASASRSLTWPQSAPIAQAPKPIGLTCQPVREKARRCMMGSVGAGFEIVRTDYINIVILREGGGSMSLVGLEQRMRIETRGWYAFAYHDD